MMNSVQDKSSVQYQRTSWNALSNKINKLVNHANASNMHNILPKLLPVNFIRGRGLFCQACMNLQSASPSSTDVIAALVAVVNSQHFEVGDLLVRRVVLDFLKAFYSTNKPRLISSAKFIAHLVNQKVVHSLIAVEVTELLLMNTKNDAVEAAVNLVTESGSTLEDLCGLRLSGIFEQFRGILRDGKTNMHVELLIAGLFAARKAKFQGYPAIRPELDVVDQENQLTHQVSLYDDIDAEIALDVFSPDPNFAENNFFYEQLKALMVFSESKDESESDEDDEQMAVDDNTKINLLNLRSRIYLTIMTSDDYKEAERKLLDIKLEPGQEMVLCTMLLACLYQESAYIPYYGLLGQRLCKVKRIYKENFAKCFAQRYSRLYELETYQLRNAAKFFAHLLADADALPWHVLACIRLTADDSSRTFINFLFRELSEHLGIKLLSERLSDPGMQDSFESIFPKDDARNTRFAINFFTSIGLGGITEKLREHLKNMQQQKAVPEFDSESTSSGSESDSSRSESKSDSEDDSDDEWTKITKSTRKLVL